MAGESEELSFGNNVSIPPASSLKAKINTSSKGYKKEKLCADELQNTGHIVIYRSQRLRFGMIDFGYRPSKEERNHPDYPKNLELWKRAKFDIIAVKPANVKTYPVPSQNGEVNLIIEPCEWRLISVKNSGWQRKYAGHQEELKEWKKRFWTNGMSIELWIWNKPRYVGRGKNKKWCEAHWNVIKI